jgi:DNA-binding GntR family transcriptional regulator
LPAIADYEIASALSLSVSSPVLYLETITSDEGGLPVDLVQMFCRSDRVKYTFRFDLDETRIA